VWVTADAFVPTFVAVTSAFETTAPLGSDTVPTRFPLIAWPKAMPTLNISKLNITITNVRGLEYRTRCFMMIRSSALEKIVGPTNSAEHQCFVRDITEEVPKQRKARVSP
jgi:hypothetical protein